MTPFRATIADILPNYRSLRHFLQIVHGPVRDYRGPPFLYMKNHKADCTNILCLLITHMHAATGAAAGLPEPEISLANFIDLIADNPKALNRDRHWRPQHKEISYGQIPYDLIGRVEEMDSVRQTIVDVLFDGRALPEVDTREKLGHRTASADLVATLTATHRRKIETVFARDFEMYEQVRSAEV